MRRLVGFLNRDYRIEGPYFLRGLKDRAVALLDCRFIPDWGRRVSNEALDLLLLVEEVVFAIGSELVLEGAVAVGTVLRLGEQH